MREIEFFSDIARLFYRLASLGSISFLPFFQKDDKPATE
jgi:hypothetical protein